MTKYIDMKQFIANEVNWQHPDFPVIAQFFSVKNKDAPAGYWKIDESYIKEIK